MSNHESNQENWRAIASQAAEEKDPGKLIDLTQRLIEKFDEEQRSKKPSSSVTGDAK